MEDTQKTPNADQQSVWDELVRLGLEISQNWDALQTPSEILSEMRK